MSNVVDKKPNPKLRDSMFKLIFRQDEYLQQLAEQLLNKQFKPGEVKTITLNPVFVNERVNDLGLTARDEIICLVEAQSTEPINIAVRMLGYASQSVEQYLLRHPELNVYGSKKIRLPAIKLYVMYTGQKPVKSLYQLGDHVHDCDINLYVATLAREFGNCPPVLQKYLAFCDVYSEAQSKKLSGSALVEYVVTNCRKRDIFAELISQHLQEVKDMLSYEERVALQRERDALSWKEEGLEEGLEEGRKEGLEEGLQIAVDNVMRAMKLTKDEAIAIVTGQAGALKEQWSVQGGGPNVSRMPPLERSSDM